MRVFATKSFVRFAGKNRISDHDLCQVVSEAASGLVDAKLGSGVIKQRVSRKGEGKSGAFRAILVFRQGELAFFVHAFAKNDVGNISSAELVAVRKLAKELLRHTNESLARAVVSGNLNEVKCHAD